MSRTTTRAFAASLAACLLAAAACTSSGDSVSRSPGTTSAFGDAGNCVVVDMAVSSEKIDLINSLATTFNGQKHKISSGACIYVRPQSKASGGAATLLSTTWDSSTDGPQPVIWSPASAAWGAVLNQRLADAGEPAMAPADSPSFMLTPLVIAMPKPMATALGYPEKPVGWADLARLATDPAGWSAYGHAEWGPFRLGKTNPNYSTSGLSALIAQTYAAANKTTGLGSEDLTNPAVVDFSKKIESSVVHYGDITMTFLNNWFKADRRGTSLTYASAVAVEEKSVIDYNLGNPDGVLSPGETPRAPKVPLVSIYPSEGTLFSDSPFYVLDAPWVNADEKEAAKAFSDFVQTPANQKRVLKFGFRPANPAVKVGSPIVAANGADPSQPTTLLDVPQPSVMLDLLSAWARNRKTARVLMVLDVSGSMGQAADGKDGESKLELAKQAAIDALDQFNPEDEVGLRIFTTDMGSDQRQEFQDLQPIAPIGANKEKLAASIRDLIPLNGTPLYSVAQSSYDEMFAGYDPTRINAVILLTDGANDDGNQNDDQQQQQRLLADLRKGSSGENSKPVRMFTVAYGADAQTDALSQMADASNAAAYSAKDATTIAKVFTQVVSNF
ncbi:MAG: substrate-binding domain-containing protein [Acidimicrobiales bacterium]